MDNNFSKNNIDVLSVGLPLSDFGINNWGLTKEEALTTIQKFDELIIPILGGDVLRFEDGHWVHTYDNWYCNKLPNETEEQFVIRSNQLATEYVSRYNARETEILFVIVPDNT